jgi:hypothetical protein
MIVFVTSVGHPKTLKDYRKVESLLFNTLLSVCNQSDRRFKVVVVCNQVPNFTDGRLAEFVEYVPVDFPPLQEAPTIGDNGPKPRDQSLKMDKGLKLLIGIAAAQRFNPDYIMLIDSDDYISSGISRFVNSSDKTANGWFVRDGYILYHDTMRLYPEHDFNQKCGTSLIINNRLLADQARRGTVEIINAQKQTIPIDTDNTAFIGRINITTDKETLIRSFDNNFIMYIFGSHRWAARYYGLEPLPFPGAVWNCNTGENFGGTRTGTGMDPIDPRGIDMTEFFPSGPDPVAR